MEAAFKDFGPEATDPTNSLDHYDVSGNCLQPQHLSTFSLASGNHDGWFTADGSTYYPFGETPNSKVTYTGLKTSRYRFDYGPGFYDTGIPTIFPPVITPPLMPLMTDAAVPIMSANRSGLSELRAED